MTHLTLVINRPTPAKPIRSSLDILNDMRVEYARHLTAIDALKAELMDYYAELLL